MSQPAIAEIHADDDERSGVRAVRDLVVHARGGVRVMVDGKDLELPRSLLQVLVAVADPLADGETTAVIHAESELSPAEAAKVLGVSRQFVDRLIGNGTLPSRRLPDSTYKKLPARAVLEYRASRESKRSGIRDIVEDATASGIDY